MITKEVYIKIYENGKTHIESSKLLAQAGMFGFAISHLILGIEELIKYQVVLNNTGGQAVFNSVDMTAVFKDHKAKHILIEEFQTSTSIDFANAFQDYIFKISTGQEMITDHVSSNRFKEIGAFLNCAYSEINLNESERDSFFQWLKAANTLKNRGFYVNIISNQAEAPIDLTIEDYEKALKFATVIQRQTEVIKNLDISEEEFIAILNGTLP